MKSFNRAKKSTYGQNFIFDKNLLLSLVEHCDLRKEDTVLEIGAGAGTLTEVLAQKVGKVVSVEIDSTLMPYLRKLEGQYSNLSIIEGDFMAWDFESFSANYPSIKVIANIPYYITTPIYHRLLFSQLNMQELSCMVQLEVAHKILANPNDKNNYGTLSLLCQHHYEPVIVEVVGKEHFSPVPKVDSAFVRMVKKTNIPYDANFDNAYYKLIKAAFLHRRKTLLNSLKASGYDTKALQDALANIGLSELIRPENLYYTDYVKLVEYLTNYQNPT